MNGHCLQQLFNVGVAIENEHYRLSLCESGQIVEQREFSTDAEGQSKLKQFIGDLKKPARIAIGATTTAAVSMAIALSSIAHSEIFLVSPRIAAQSIDLARYVERTI